MHAYQIVVRLQGRKYFVCQYKQFFWLISSKILKADPDNWLGFLFCFRNSTDYELWLRYDLYTNKHTQWFYFRVSNTRANKTYRFTIVNFMKV